MDKIAEIKKIVLDVKRGAELREASEVITKIVTVLNLPDEPQSDQSEDKDVPFTPCFRTVTYITEAQCQARIEALIKEIERIWSLDENRCTEFAEFIATHNKNKQEGED